MLIFLVFLLSLNHFSTRTAPKEVQLLTGEVGYSPQFLLPELAVGVTQRIQQ